MEFWGVEVKAGQKLKVQPEFGQLIHISQASLGEVKDVKGAKHVPLRVKIDDKNFIIGSLSAELRPQVMFDLVFEREFELSHDWKNGSIYFLGYVADDPVSEDDELSSGDDESEDELQLEAPQNGVVAAKAEAGPVKPAGKAAAAAKGAGVKDKAKKEEEQDSDEDDDDDEDDSESGSDDEMNVDGVPEMDSDDEDDSEDEDDDEDESEEETPKVQQSKKRPAGSAEKTPLTKKAKPATPEKSGKKGQNATPAPSKSAGKTPNKGKEQSPKSGGQLSCKSCSKTFNSENAMQAHSKAKHGGK